MDEERDLEQERDQDTNGKPLDISLPEQVAGGVYSNLQVVQHSPAEFIIDFIQIMPNVKTAQVRSRVILAPIYAKRLLNALQENIARYEMKYGEIEDTSNSGVEYTDINPMGKA